MDEIFVERIVKRKIDIKGMLLRVLAVNFLPPGLQSFALPGSL